MKFSKIAIIFVILSFVGVFLYLIFNKPTSRHSSIENSINDEKEVINFTMKFTSNAFENNGNIPAKYTCDGENINPPLTAAEVPEEAKSLALIVDDPDAPGGDWVHWLVWNINPTIDEIKEGVTPEGGVEGLNDFGKNNYGGPCPPGKHKYLFKLYALDTNLDLGSETKKRDLLDAMEGHILAQSVLNGYYQRR